MNKILLIGKGNLYSSMIHFLSVNDVKETIIVVNYEQRDDLLRHPLLEFFKIKDFERIYLVPETIEDGIFFTAHFSEIYNGCLFVVTEDYRSNLIYKKMGADYVIISKPECKCFSWFPIPACDLQGGDDTSGE